MPKKIQYELSDDQLNKLKKIYENSKGKLKDNIDTFDKFIDWTIDLAIETHIQFSSMNDKMMDMIDSSVSGIDLNNIDEFINNIFDNSSSNNTVKKNKESNDDNAKKTTANKIKN